MFPICSKKGHFKQVISNNLRLIVNRPHKISIDLPLLIFLIFPDEKLLVSFQKSCMKELNPVLRLYGENVLSQSAKNSSRFALNPRSALRYSFVKCAIINP